MLEQRFRNFKEFHEFASSPMLPEFGRMGRASQRTYNTWELSPWAGTHTWGDLESLNKYGWPEGEKMVKDVLMKVGTSMTGFIPVKDYVHTTEPTFEIDMTAYLQGEPEVFIEEVPLDEFIEVQNAPRLVRIVYNVCVSGSFSAEQLKWRGAAVVALANILEMHNIQTKIDMVAANRSDEGFETWITTKDFGDPMDINRVAFMTAHPAVFRRMIFSCWEHTPEATRKAFRFFDSGGYGYVGTTEDKGDIYLEGHERGDPSDLKTTIDWVKKHLAEYGITIEQN